MYVLCLQFISLVKKSFHIGVHILIVSSVKVNNAGIITDYFIKFNLTHAQMDNHANQIAVSTRKDPFSTEQSNSKFQTHIKLN